MKWSLCCDDSTIRFSVVLNVQGTQEVRMLEDAHRVKGDGRYDMCVMNEVFIVEERLFVMMLEC